MRSLPALPALLLGLLSVAALGCGDDPPATADARPLDAAVIDAPPVDAAIDAPGLPLPGFGAITGECGVLTPAGLADHTPRWFGGEFTFDNRYDDPAERGLLTPGGQHIVSVDNAGGSSVFSEVFAYEWLARCELATLLKTETEIVYDVVGKKADLLVEIDGQKVGVSVTRAVTFPFGQPYTLAAATSLFDRKLDDIQLAATQVSAADRWSRSMVAALAYDPQHAQVAMQAWNMLDAATRGDVILVVAVTHGDDLFVYTDM
jgi:hypothetical protein